MKAKNTRQKIGEWLKWLIPILLFLLPVLWAGYYQAADLLGVQQLPQAETLTRWMLGLLTLWLTSQGLQAIFSERPGQRIEDQLEKHFGDLEKSIDQISIPRLALCHTRNDTFDALAKILEQARPASTAQKTISMTYFSQAYSDQEELAIAFERERNKKLLEEQGWTFQHLWTIQSPEKFFELKRDLEQFKNVSGYLVRVLPSLPKPFMLEMYTVGGDNALLSIPSERREGAVETSYHFMDKESVRYLQNYFDLMWQKATPIKTGEGINPHALSELERKLGEGESIMTFKSRNETYDYMAPQLAKLRPRKIDIIDNLPEWPRPLPNHDRWIQHDKLLKEGAEHYRIVRVSTLDQWNSVLKMMEYWKDVRFRLACILTEPNNEIPIVQSQILNEEVVYFGQRFLGRDQQGSVMIADQGVASLFKAYFEFLLGQSIKVRTEQKDYPLGDPDAIAEIERRLKEKEAVPSSAKGIRVHLTTELGMKAMIDKVRQASSTRETISYSSLESPAEWRNELYRELRAAIERGLEQRYIIWNLEHIKWLKSKFAEGWDKLPGFAVKLLPFHAIQQPLTWFSLTDNRYVFMAHGWRNGGIIEIDDVDVANVFKAYFDKIWWMPESILIKQAGALPDLELLERLEKELLERNKS